MASTPSGWYANPDDPATERWWDGERWGEATRPRTSFAPPVPPGAYAFNVASTNKPDSYLAWSILSTLFCCLPFGIAAIVQSARVDGLWMAGDYAGAHAASRKARYWIKWAVGVSALVVVGYILLIVLIAAFGDPEPTYRYEYP